MRENFKRKVLNNGMTILFEKRDIPVVSVAFAVRNGGVNENLDEKGISHFIEHMLYKGTDKRTAFQISSEIEKKGGQMNGFTDEEITAYFCKIPSEHLNIALDVLSDIVKNPKFDNDELEKERKVIFEEIKMRRDIPQVYVIDKIQKTLYDGVMNISLIGNEKTMNSINREKILNKFNEIYCPNNLVLCVVGDANFEDVVKFAKNNFGNKKGNVPEQKFDLKNESKIEKRKGLDQANLVFAYHVPFGEDKKNYAAQVLNSLTAEGMSSRLFTEIREKRNLAYAVKGNSEINKRFGYNFIYIGTTKENVEKVKELIINELKDVSENLQEKELQEVKTQIIGNYKIGMEDSQSQMMNLLYYEIENSASDFYEYEENIRNVKLEDVKEIAKLASSNFSFFALVPEE